MCPSDEAAEIAALITADDFSTYTSSTLIQSVGIGIAVLFGYW